LTAAQRNVTILGSSFGLIFLFQEDVMAAKIIAGIVLVVALAAAGTAGVAYYNDPTVFDSTESTSNLAASEKSAVEPASGGSCCQMAEPAEKSCCESQP
jgi:hypothetical protein